ncbi:ABC transporter substrate-binding protein [Pseudoalteromonas tunicata]|nr:ABC transporter substrate-binding protein [Pseudoalteromonas tunicata]EAR26320.1 putative leu/ile/val-binding lipoprotein transmembrane [Pseudoalteromonas tunicata D2]
MSANLKRYFYYFCLFFLSFAGQAEFGISADKITIGMSNPQSGPSANLGQQFKLGAVTHFNAVNLQGGINGKKIELLSLDDG